MGGSNLKPWTFGTIFPTIAVLFFGTIACFMVASVPTLKVTLASRILIVLLAAAGVAAAISTFMWARVWRDVQWDESFWAFVSGPEPQYEEAQRAWRWGRRFRLSWVILMVTMFLVPLVEAVARRLR